MPSSELKFKNTINESEGSYETPTRHLFLKPIIKYSDTNLTDVANGRLMLSEQSFDQQFGKEIKVDMSDIKSSISRRQSTGKRIWYVFIHSIIRLMKQKKLINRAK